MGLSCNPQNGRHLVWIEPDKLDSVRLDVDGKAYATLSFSQGFAYVPLTKILLTIMANCCQNVHGTSGAYTENTTELRHAEALTVHGQKMGQHVHPNKY